MPAEELDPDDESATVASWEATGLTRTCSDPEADLRQGPESAGSTVLDVRDGATLVGAAPSWLGARGVAETLRTVHHGNDVTRNLYATLGWAERAETHGVVLGRRRGAP